MNDDTRFCISKEMNGAAVLHLAYLVLELLLYRGFLCPLGQPSPPQIAEVPKTVIAGFPWFFSTTVWVAWSNYLL